MLLRTDFPFSSFSHEMTCFSRYVGNGFSVPTYRSISIMLCFTISQSNSLPELREPSNLILNLAFIFRLHSIRLITFFLNFLSILGFILYYFTTSISSTYGQVTQASSLDQSTAGGFQGVIGGACEFHSSHCFHFRFVVFLFILNSDHFELIFFFLISRDGPLLNYPLCKLCS